MSKLLHPRARLVKIRNVRSGLYTRSQILFLLEESLELTATDIARKVEMSYSRVLRQLRNLERERIVERSEERPFTWRSTPYGQQALFGARSSKEV